jgi:hypothetical protein
MWRRRAVRSRYCAGMRTDRRAAIGGIGLEWLALLSLGASAGCSANSATAPTGGDASTHAPPVATSADDAEPPPDAGSPAPAPTGDGAASSDDAASDAGPGPAGDGGRDYSTDPSTFLGPTSRCADAGLQLCEDFETGSLDTKIWTPSGTPVVIDGMQHARGTHALHITQHGNGNSYIRESVTFPEPNDTYFGRVFVYFKSLPTPAGTANGYAHWTMLAASGTGVPGEIRVSGQLQNGKNLFGVGTDNQTDGGSGDWTNSDNDPKGAPVAVPLDKWLCIEWMHKGDTNETAFWWDGVPHPSLSTTAGVKHGGNPGNPYLLPDFKQLWIGWQEYQTSAEVFESWIDAIAIDRQRIGCVL